jgi:hypothetical protein
MPNPVVTWVLELNPSDKTTFELTNVADLKITNATLDPILQDETGRSTVILHIMTPKMDDSEDDDEDSEDASDLDFGEAPPQKLVLTSLTPGKVGSPIQNLYGTLTVDKRLNRRFMILLSLAQQGWYVKSSGKSKCSMQKSNNSWH